MTVDSTRGEGTTFTILMPMGTAHLPSGRVGATRTGVSTATRADAFVGEALRWLPMSDSGGAADAVISPTRDAADTTVGNLAADGQRPRVLVADDNSDMRNYVQRLLAAAASAVEAVPDGQAALEAARRTVLACSRNCGPIPISRRCR